MVAVLIVPLAAFAAHADTSDELKLCRDQNTASERRIDACNKVIADPADKHAKYLAYANRAQTFYSAARGDKAIPDISKAISLEPDNVAGYRIRGGMYHAYREYDKAVADLSVVLKETPGDVLVLRLRAGCYGMLGKHDLAIADYDAIIRLKPDDAIAFYMRAFEQVERKDFARARPDFERAFGLDSSLADDFPASCFDVGPFEKRRVLVNWPECEREAN
jgi:tetratricopeptide (TPR) repeat protein